MSRHRAMCGALGNRRGEGYIRTAAVAVIAVVVGALILAGCYRLFAGENAIFKVVGTKVDIMLAEDSVEVRRAFIDGQSIIQYSLDGVNWKKAEIPGFGASSSAATLIDNGSGDYTVWLVMIRTMPGSIVCSSENGIVWTPLFYDSVNINLTKSNGVIYVQCYDGRGYMSTDGVSWTMTSTGRY